MTQVCTVHITRRHSCFLGAGLHAASAEAGTEGQGSCLCCRACWPQDRPAGLRNGARNKHPVLKEQQASLNWDTQHPAHAARCTEMSCACLLQVLMQPVHEQAQKNKEAISAAGNAGRLADQLGPENDARNKRQAQKQRQASLNTDTQHRFANASLSAPDYSPETHARPSKRTSADVAKHSREGSQQQAETLPGSGRGAGDSAKAGALLTGSRRAGEGDFMIQQPESRLSPCRDKRGRDETRRERSSKARRSIDGPCSPQASAFFPCTARL